MESGKQNNSEIGQAFRGAGGGAELRCAAAAVAGRSGPRSCVCAPVLCCRRRSPLPRWQLDGTLTCFLACTRCGGALRLLTRTRQRAHHRSPAVYVRSVVGSRMSKHRARAHPPSAPTICEVVRLPDNVKKLCASTDRYSPFRPRSCPTGATVLAKPTSDAVVAVAPPGCTGISLPARERCCVASKPRRAASASRGSMVVESASRPDTTRSLTYASLGPLYNRAVRGVWGEQACAHGGSACTAFEAVRLSDQTYVASIRQVICTVTSDARLRSGEHHGILRTRPQRRRTRFGRPRCRPRTTEGSSPPRKECLDVGHQSQRILRSHDAEARLDGWHRSWQREAPFSTNGGSRLQGCSRRAEARRGPQSDRGREYSNGINVTRHDKRDATDRHTHRQTNK